MPDSSPRFANRFNFLWFRLYAPPKHDSRSENASCKTVFSHEYVFLISLLPKTSLPFPLYIDRKKRYFLWKNSVPCSANEYRRSGNLCVHRCRQFFSEIFPFIFFSYPIGNGEHISHMTVFLQQRQGCCKIIFIAVRR